MESIAHRVLIADADQVSREYLRLVLRQGGYEVATASLAAHAFRFMEQHRPDLVLVDTAFSESGGFSVLRRLGELALRLKLEPRFVMVAAFDRKFEREQAALAGAVEFIVKPVQPTPLLRQLGELLALSPAGRN
jgi:CheY-like chemotaxis protein